MRVKELYAAHKIIDGNDAPICCLGALESSLFFCYCLTCYCFGAISSPGKNRLKWLPFKIFILELTVCQGLKADVINLGKVNVMKVVLGGIVQEVFISFPTFIK